MSEGDIFYQGKQEPIKSCLLILRDMILDQDQDISETTKYGMPCFLYKKRAFAYLWVDKKNNEPYILFVAGGLLDHPKLEMGKRKRMKIFRVDPKKEIPVETTQKLLDSALDLYRNGKVAVK